jgi:hypothetical protein
MNDDFDVELRQRLEGLATVVPVDRAGGLVPVAPSMRPGRLTRRLASRLLIPAVLVALVAAVFGSGAGQRPTATLGASPAPNTPSPLADGPVVTTDVDGDFELTVRSTQARYRRDEPLNVEGSLTYHGAQASVDICTDSAPMLFGIREKILGGIDLQPVSRLMFDHSMLARDVPLTKPFAKSGGFSGDDPNAASFRAFFADPVLRLPVGTWHMYAVSRSCSPGPLNFQLEAEIEISVDEPPTTTPGPPSADSTATVEVQLRTAAAPNTTGECLAARLEGTLAASVTTGLGVHEELPAIMPRSGGVVVDVLWPFGWSAHRSGDDILLIDDTGRIVARTGDVVAFAGGFTSRPTGSPGASTVVDGPFAVCGRPVSSPST